MVGYFNASLSKSKLESINKRGIIASICGSWYMARRRK